MVVMYSAFIYLIAQIILLLIHDDFQQKRQNHNGCSSKYWGKDLRRSRMGTGVFGLTTWVSWKIDWGIQV